MRRRGFTLLETLVALACAAILLVALYGAVLRTTIAQARASARADRTVAARGALLAMASELEAARAPGVAGERLVVGAAPDGGPPWQTLHFVTGARAPAVAADDLPVVEYRIAPSGTGPTGTLVRGEKPRLGAPGAVAPEPLLLVESVRQFRVRCSDGRAWTPAWSAAALPRAVEIVLDVDDGAGGSEQFATTVTLLVAGGG